jgi:hypothetical protein
MASTPARFLLVVSLVHAAPVDDEEAHRIVDACQTIRNCPGICTDVAVHDETCRGVH